MRHRWDYHGADARTARSRSCTRCQAAGRRYGPNSTPWDTRMPDGSFHGTDAVPPCPGTPWTHRDGRWELPLDSLRERFAVTDEAIRRGGRVTVEQQLARAGRVPLPDEAWKVLR